MSVGIVVGKIAVSLMAAFAVTYFRFRFRRAAFWLIFVSLMLPIEVRIVPTYEVGGERGAALERGRRMAGPRRLARTLSGRDAKLTSIYRW